MQTEQTVTVNGVKLSLLAKDFPTVDADGIEGKPYDEKTLKYWLHKQMGLTLADVVDEGRVYEPTISLLRLYHKHVIREKMSVTEFRNVFASKIADAAKNGRQQKPRTVFQTEDEMDNAENATYGGFGSNLQAVEQQVQAVEQQSLAISVAIGQRVYVATHPQTILGNAMKEFARLQQANSGHSIDLPEMLAAACDYNRALLGETPSYIPALMGVSPV